MGHSSLLGIDPAAPEAPGRDPASLGPGDSSDSGSDLMGITDPENEIEPDPGQPTDIGVDRIDGPGRKGRQAIADDEDADLAFVDSAEAADPLEDEDEEEVEEELEEEAGIERATRVRAGPPAPPGQQPNPAPDVPEPPPVEGEDPLPDESEEEDRRPGRTAALLRRP